TATVAQQQDDSLQIPTVRRDIRAAILVEVAHGQTVGEIAHGEAATGPEVALPVPRSHEDGVAELLGGGEIDLPVKIEIRRHDRGGAVTARDGPGLREFSTAVSEQNRQGADRVV